MSAASGSGATPVDTPLGAARCWVTNGGMTACDGLGITISYWESEEAIRHWHQQAEHKLAQQKGYEIWYESFMTRVCKVERDYGFERGRE